jgi:hypothetical protein
MHTSRDDFARCHLVWCPATDGGKILRSKYHTLLDSVLNVEFSLMVPLKFDLDRPGKRRKIGQIGILA